jgi:hypothetical protein
MGFLDNSGDIILDVVLTDLGRQRLAKGDGSFNITKFALGDDEIDYALYNKNDISGSSYYDLEILQSPVFEAFTDNAASMHSKLLTFENPNLLFLPVLKLNQSFPGTSMNASGSFMIAVDRNTEDNTATTSPATSIGTSDEGKVITGIIFGESLGAGAQSVNYVRVDQGLDTTQVSAKQRLNADLVETEYMIQIDNRFGSIVSYDGTNTATPDYIDDDNIAYYTFSLGTDQLYVITNTVTDDTATETISGPRGTFLRFSIGSSLELNTSTYLFTQLGSTAGMPNAAGTSTVVKVIDSIIKVSGMTTGYTIDIPARFVKL